MTSTTANSIDIEEQRAEAELAQRVADLMAAKGAKTFGELIEINNTEILQRRAEELGLAVHFHEGRYMVTDLNNNVVAGADYSLEAQETEAFLKEHSE